MSFCNSGNPRTPGVIRGNPIQGLCERVCIQAKKVFDACVRQVSAEDTALSLSGFSPPNPAAPLTFVSARSSTTRGTLSNVHIDKLADRPREARLRCDVTIPIEIFYLDANNAEGRASGEITTSNDLIICVPAPSVMPFEIEASVNVICPDGSFSSETSASVSACITSIIKIIVEADILVPSYGYCYIPPCEGYDNQVCSTFFELPLFP
ncbi:MAG: hypothetical protein LBS99_02675 [Clostridiales bacterium]|jgi:hypothetical protein|nr:hypothetical protein [Clostridiales bacterium]